MAKRKTPKVDLAPRAEKISKTQLETLKQAATTIKNLQTQLGSIECQKHDMLHEVDQNRSIIMELRSVFKKEYGTDAVDINDGTIKYNNGNN